ncbi:MAG: DUF4234 domain-containing protein [Candidatus Micrarchaeota archaeon]|nr:DUF4234 domain-containing protein [Candidatus Micrarchaeota archaeon]
MVVKKRNPLVVIVLTFITLGIYALYWLYQTKQEMDELNGESKSGIMFLIMLLIPLVNFYALWKYSSSVQKATKGAQGGVLVFILFLVFFPIAQFLVQSELNKFAK